MADRELALELKQCRQRVSELEDDLVKSEAKWRSVLEYIPEIGVSLNSRGQILYVNKPFLAMTGWTFEEIYLKSWFELCLPEDVREEMQEVFLRVIGRKQGMHSQYQNEIVTREGLRRSVSWLNVLTLDSDGNVADVTCLGTDLTAQDEAKAAILASEECLALALEASKDAVWDWDVVTGEVYLHPRRASILGYEPDEISNTYEMWKGLVHQEDIEGVEAVLNQAIADHESFECEHRMLGKNGLWKWVLTRGKVIPPGKQGGHLRVIGTHADIDERKQAEEALKQAKEAAEEANRALRVNTAHLRTLVEITPELVWLKDIDGVFILCNHRFERLYGATEAEIVGKTDYDFVDKSLADSFRAYDRRAMEAGKPVINEETVTYKDDGHTEELETIKMPMYDDRGELVGVLGVARDITERNRIAEELRESELRFKALHNASFGGIIIHDQGRILDCNQGLIDITGYTREELLNLDELEPIAESSREEVQRNILAGNEKPYIVTGVRKNGEEYPLRLAAKNIPYKGRMARVVEFRDITDRKRAEMKLRDSELRHRVIFENSPLGVVRFSEKGIILDCNDNFVELMGSSKEHLIGLNAARHQSNLMMRDALAVALAGRASSYEDYYTSMTGNKTVFLHAQFNPVNPGQSPTEVIATMEDFGERKEAQDELRRAKEQAEEYSRSKTEFLANMSHEIRTPLNGLMGMLQLMQTTGLNGEQSEYVQAAFNSSRRLMNLLSDILDLSRVEAGKLVVQKTLFSLPETCEQACELFKITSAQTGVALKCDLDPHLPAMALGDPVRLQQVLINLVGNAFKFTTHGQITLSAHRLSDVLSEDYRVLFSVSDTGVGIPDTELDTLFDPFTQVSQGYTRTHQGAGLGLAICKRLVGLMGGSMSIESEEGRGTTFYVAIPFGRSEQLPQPCPRVKGEPAVLNKKLRVLLAEDERVNCLVTQRLLEKDGHTVSAVENGRQALEALRAQEYDIVLMDIQMPEMDGIEATKAIRNGLAGIDWIDIPIVAVTAYAMVGDREKFMEAGMDGYVVKPVELDKLQAVLTDIQDRPRKLS